MIFFLSLLHYNRLHLRITPTWDNAISLNIELAEEFEHRISDAGLTAFNYLSYIAVCPHLIVILVGFYLNLFKSSKVMNYLCKFLIVDPVSLWASSSLIQVFFSWIETQYLNIGNTSTGLGTFQPKSKGLKFIPLSPSLADHCSFSL